MKQVPWNRHKILYQESEVKRWLQGQKVYPVQAEIDLTNKCNHDCPKCSGWRSSIPLDAELETLLVQKFLAEFKSLGGKSVLFSGGGEPTMHRDYGNLIHYAVSIGIDAGSITNGEFLDRFDMQRLVRDLDWIRVSVDAATPELYRQMHGVKTAKRFERVLKNIGRLAKIKGNSEDGAIIGTAYLVNDQTAKEVVAVTEKLVQLGVDYIQFRPFQYIRGDAWYSPETQQVLDAAKKLGNEKTRVVVSDWRGDLDLTKHYQECHAAPFVAKIASNGKVYLCCNHQNNPRFEFGDIRQSSLKEIWDSGRLEELISQVDVRTCIPLCKLNSHNETLQILKDSPEKLEEMLKALPREIENVNFL